MEQSREEIVAWVGGQVLPHEADVRAWLRRRVENEAEVEDLVQDAYCKISALTSVAHIASGRAYFFRIAQNLLADQRRRARIVRIEGVPEIDALDALDEEPSPERIVAGRRELERVRAIIAHLPERCRRIFELRRIHGLSQREAARRLGVTENVIESQSIRGLKLILEALASQQASPAQPSVRTNEREHERTRR